MGHPMGFKYCPIGRSTALLDNTRVRLTLGVADAAKYTAGSERWEEPDSCRKGFSLTWRLHAHVYIHLELFTHSMVESNHPNRISNQLGNPLPNEQTTKLMCTPFTQSINHTYMYVHPLPNEDITQANAYVLCYSNYTMT